MASWTLKGTSLSDNGTRVTCQGSKSTEALVAILRVYGKDSVTFQNRVFKLLLLGSAAEWGGKKTYLIPYIDFYI